METISPTPRSGAWALLAAAVALIMCGSPVLAQDAGAVATDSAAADGAATEDGAKRAADASAAVQPDGAPASPDGSPDLPAGTPAQPRGVSSKGAGDILLNTGAPGTVPGAAAVGTIPAAGRRRASGIASRDIEYTLPVWTGDVARSDRPTIFASLDVAFNDNIFATGLKVNPFTGKDLDESSLVTTALVGVAWLGQRNGGRQQFSLGGNFSFQSYSEDSELNDWQADVLAAVLFRSHSVDFSLRDRFSRRVQPLDVVDDRTGRLINTFTSAVVLRRSRARFQISGTHTLRAEDEDDAFVGDSIFKDLQYQDVTGRAVLSFQARDSFRIGVGAAYGRLEYENDTRSPSAFDHLSVFLRLEGRVQARQNIRYELDLGFAAITDVENPRPTAEEDDSDVYVLGRLTWTAPDNRAGIKLTAERGFGPVPSTTRLNFQKRTVARLDLHHRIGRAVRASVFGEVRFSERDGIGFDPDEPSVFRAGGGLSWQVGRRVQTYLSYSFLTRDSDDPGRDYDQNIVSVGVNVGF